MGINSITMQRMFAHINAFVDLMNRKGYDGMFLSDYGFPGKLKENLTKHVFQCYEERKLLDKVHLTTYSHWRDNEKPHIRCLFTAEFSDLRGFQIRNLRIEKADYSGVFRKKDIALHRNEDLPTREDAGKMMLEKRNQIKL